MAEAVSFIYYVIFAIAATALTVAFIRMGDEKVVAWASGVTALFCWIAVVSKLILYI